MSWQTIDTAPKGYMGSLRIMDDKNKQAERETMIAILENEQNNLAASRRQCGECEGARWDALQQVIEYLTATPAPSASSTKKTRVEGYHERRGATNPVFYGNHDAKASASPAALTDDWRDQLAALIDIYDDAMNNPPESRTYVDGAFKQQMDEARAMLTATPAPSASPEPVAWMVTHPELKAQPGNEIIVQARESALNYLRGGWTVRPLVHGFAALGQASPSAPTLDECLSAFEKAACKQTYQMRAGVKAVMDMCASPAALTSDDLTELGLFIASLRATVRSGKKQATVHQSDVDVLDSAYAALAASPADQVEDARDAALEEAAKICEAQGRASESIDGNSFYIAIGQAALAIRAAMSASKEGDHA